MITLWLTLHILASTFWVGGMLFVHFALRETLTENLQPPQRLPVWFGVLRRFFGWVWLSIGVLHASGYALLFTHFGGMANAGMHIHLMLGLAWVMTIIFAYIYFLPFPRLRKAVAEQEWPSGGAQMKTLRLWVTTNLVLGVLVVCIGATGKYWMA